MSSNRFNRGSLLNIQDTFESCLIDTKRYDKKLTRTLLVETGLRFNRTMEELRMADKLFDGEISQEHYQKEMEIIAQLND